MNARATILIIDRDALLRKLLRVMLEDLEYRIVEAGDGLEGLEICSHDPPDIVLLDTNLADPDSFQVCQRLRQEASLKDVPVIFLGVSQDPQEKVRAFTVGGVDHITKPFQSQEFAVRIETHLELRRQKVRLEESQLTLQKALFDAGMLNKKLIAMNESLRQSEALKSQFIANMRNEINNPLGAILGLAEEITHSSLPVEQNRLLAQMIESEASGLDFQIRNIFCAAELEAGEACPVITNVDVGSVLRDVVDSMAHFSESKSVKIELSGLREGDALLFATDGGKLRVISANLIHNAMKFSPSGSVIEVHAEIRDDALFLTVKDQGIGISQADKGVIFERFRQLDTGPMRQHPGQGLGLSIVKALVELLNGWVSVESSSHQGSLFTCSLPRGSVEENFGDASFGGGLVVFGDGDEM